MRLHKILPTCVGPFPFREPMSYGGAWPYLYAVQ